MRIIIAFILLSAMSLSLSAQNFTIKGHFTDVANDTLLIKYVKHEPEKEVVNESVPIDENGFFIYRCDIQWAYNAELAIRSSGDKTFFFFVPDERVEIEGPSASDSDWDIDGTAFYQRMDSVSQLLLPFYREFDAARAKYEKGLADGRDTATLDSERKAANLDIKKGCGRCPANI